MPYAELVAGGNDRETIVGDYVTARLLTIDNDPAQGMPMVEIAHEALLTHWERLRTWRSEAHHDLRQREQFLALARTWEDSGRDPGCTVGDTLLAQLRGWVMRNPVPAPIAAFHVACEESELERQQTAADHAARLQELAQMRQRNAFYSDMTNQMANQGDYKQVVQVVADKTRASLHPDRVDIFISDNERQPYYAPIVAWPEADTSPATLTPAQVATLAEYDLPEALFIYDTQAPPALDTDVLANLEPAFANYRALVVLSLTQHNICFGFFVLGYHEPTRLSDEDQRYLRDARNMLYSAVETHYVVAQTQSSLEETGILYQLLRGLLVAENVEDVCATFVDYVADPTMEQVLFFELQDGPWHAPEAHLTSLARFQKHHQSPLPERLTRAAFAGWDILAHDRPTIVADTTADPALNAAQRAAFLEMGFGALVCFPWRYTNKLTGCLLMGSAAPHAFSERDERLSISALDCLAHRILQLRGQMP